MSTNVTANPDASKPNVRTVQGDGTSYDAELANVQVDAETDTVRGQLNNYTDFSTPLMQRVAAQAREKANSRGLGNSTIAQGAANGAMLDKAVQMATTDAQIYSNRKTENQRAGTQLESTAMSNKTSIVNTNSTNASRVAAAGISANATVRAAQINAAAQKEALILNNDFKTEQAALDREHQSFQNERERNLRETLGNLDADVRMDIARMQQETEEARQRNSAVDSAWSNYQAALGNIDPNASATSQQTQARRIKESFQARMEFLNQGLNG